MSAHRDAFEAGVRAERARVLTELARIRASGPALETSSMLHRGRAQGAQRALDAARKAIEDAPAAARKRPRRPILPRALDRLRRIHCPEHGTHCAGRTCCCRDLHRTLP